jgi:two-component system, cell cycle response regulator DivK
MSKVVMIVEDYTDARLMMKFVIQWYGYDVIEAADGYEAIEKNAQYHPELILMDLALPLMDGAAAAKVIREMAGFDKVPIVAVTAYGNTSFEKMIEAGFDDVFLKPVIFEELEPILHRYLD